MNKEMFEAMVMKVRFLEERREETAFRIRSLADVVESLQREIDILRNLQVDQEMDLIFLSSGLMAAMEE